jgi:hypothetical protein
MVNDTHREAGVQRCNPDLTSTLAAKVRRPDAASAAWTNAIPAIAGPFSR